PIARQGRGCHALRRSRASSRRHCASARAAVPPAEPPGSVFARQPPAGGKAASLAVANRCPAGGGHAGRATPGVPARIPCGAGIRPAPARHARCRAFGLQPPLPFAVALAVAFAGARAFALAVVPTVPSTILSRLLSTVFRPMPRTSANGSALRYGPFTSPWARIADDLVGHA